MAARRLIAVLVALLVVSTVLAALAPVREEDRTASTTEPLPETPPPDPLPSGGLLRERIVTAREEPARIAAAVGDQLELEVESERIAEIAIPALGLLEAAEPGDPARFSILLREPGEVAIETADGDPVGTIDVAPR